MSTDHTQQARLSLDLLHTQVDAGFSHLKALCSENGRLDPALLDQQQQVSYELSFCVADLEACKAMLLYADKANAETDLCHSVALAFCAETARGVWQRLLNHARELGLPSEQLLTLMGSDPLADFLAQHGNSRAMADIGAALLDRGNVRLPTGLGEEKDLVRESFARFADDVVMP